MIAYHRKFAAALGCTLALAGCQQKMADQPSYRPLEASSLFADGRSARPQQPGTVSQTAPDFNSTYLTGRSAGQGSQTRPVGSNSLGGRTLDNYSTQFPSPITVKQLERGQQRYTIYCAICHGPTGDGDGMIVQRGYTRPPSYLTDDSRGLAHRGIHMSLRDVPVGYLFEVIGKGYGAMSDYSAQVSPADRWDIVAYVRTLQFSQEQPLDQLSPSQQADAKTVLEATP